MSVVLKNPNIQGKTYEFILYSILFFLITVVYFGGVINTFHFFFTFERNIVYTIIPKILFIVLIIVQLCVPDFGKNLVLTFLDPIIFEKYKQKVHNLSSFFTNYPFLSFLFIHILLCLTFLHYFSLYFASSDLFLEIFYYFFNLIKIFFLPVYIFSYVLANLPSSFLVQIDVSAQTIEAGKKVLVESLELTKKYPKTGGTLAAGAVGAAALLAAGKQARNEVQDASKRSSPGNIDQAALDSNPKLQDAQDCLFDLEHQISKPLLVVGAESVKRWVSGEPSLGDDYHQTQKITRHEQTRTLGELAHKKKLKEEEWRIKVLESGNLPKSNTNDVVYYDSPIEPASSTEIPSCLESFYDFF